MKPVQFTKDSVLASGGQPITELMLIAKGSVRASFFGGEHLLGKGDVAGVCEVTSDIHKITYTVLEDTTVISYPFSGIDGLEVLFQSHPELGGLFCMSAAKLMQGLLRQYDMIEYECSSLYSTCHGDYTTYLEICKRNMFAPRTLTMLEDLTTFEGEVPLEGWLISYYDGLSRLLTSGCAEVLVREPSVATGLIGKSAQDARLLLDAYETMAEYAASAHKLYFNQEEDDFFDLYSSTYLKAGRNSEDFTLLHSTIQRMISQLPKMHSISNELASSRIQTFREQQEIFVDQENNSTSSVNSNYLNALSGSLDLILTYAQADVESATAFKESILALRSMTDLEAANEEADALRNKATSLFYIIYEQVFFHSVEDLNIPMTVKMFLYFGYVDEVLAGSDHAIYLYSLAENLDLVASPQIYTMYDWLLAIYHGEKEPSRNKFDEDYNDHINSLKAQKKINESQAKELLADLKNKVLYEIKNLFPIVNKITYGRISSYCPIFMSSQVLKPLSFCYVSPETITRSVEGIRSLDYSAFYRETLYSSESLSREFIHVEVLPDFILTPNVGIRGAMWQEIEGKRRTTPARMFLPMFALEDAQSMIIRMTGEFRWEMCKRIQGSRWNDISERSLTSEYFDYIQFYRKNHELSQDTKEKIRTSLQKAKNSFKEMFVRDYLLWILFEGTGSPRLNKATRTILFMYCPFSESVRQTLSSNPLYRDSLDQYEIKTKRRLHHLGIIQQKFRNMRQLMPDELLEEIEFTKR